MNHMGETDGFAVFPPFFVVVAAIDCWNCAAPQSPIALLASHVPAFEGAACLLSDLREIPSSLDAFLSRNFPHFRRAATASDSEELAGFANYANHCQACGLRFEEFYLHSEPGAPFFPDSPLEAASLRMLEVPLNETIRIKGSLGTGIVDLILRYAARSGGK